MNEEQMKKLAEKLLTAYDLHTRKGKGTVGIRDEFVKVIKQELS